MEIFESPNNLEPCGRANPYILESDDVEKSGLVFIDTSKAKKHIKQTYTLMLNLPHFLSWHCLGIIDLEIYRKRLFEFSALTWGQRGIILIHRSFLASFSFEIRNLLHCTNHS